MAPQAKLKIAYFQAPLTDWDEKDDDDVHTIYTMMI